MLPEKGKPSYMESMTKDELFNDLMALQREVWWLRLCTVAATLAALAFAARVLLG